MPVLVLQQGHCYRTSGATGTAGEQAFATAVGEACTRLLHGKGGWAVRRILADDPSGFYPGDAFFAIHADGSTSSAARGASVGYRTPEGQTLGQAWKRAYAARGWPGFRPDNYTAALQGYYGTGTAVSVGNRRAVIIEAGFLTNADDRALLTGPGGADRVALAIGDALGIPLGQPPLPEDDMQLGDKFPIYNDDGTYHEDHRNYQQMIGAQFFWAADVYKAAVVVEPRTARIEAKLDALAGALSDDEANVIAAVRAASNGDAEAIAQHLAPLLSGLTLGRLPEDQFADLVRAVNDENDRREAARANTPVPPA